MRQKSNRLLCIILCVALSFGMVAATTYAQEPVTLYTGGGAIIASGWNKGSLNGMYSGSGTLPNVFMAGASFQGWYTDAGLTQGPADVGSQATESAYYAKWSLSDTVEIVRPHG